MAITLLLCPYCRGTIAQELLMNPFISCTYCGKTLKHDETINITTHLERIVLDVKHVMNLIKHAFPTQREFTIQEVRLIIDNKTSIQAPESYKQKVTQLIIKKLRRKQF